VPRDRLRERRLDAGEAVETDRLDDASLGIHERDGVDLQRGERDVVKIHPLERLVSVGDVSAGLVPPGPVAGDEVELLDLRGEGVPDPVQVLDDALLLERLEAVEQDGAGGGVEDGDHAEQHAAERGKYLRAQGHRNAPGPSSV